MWGGGSGTNEALKSPKSVVPYKMTHPTVTTTDTDIYEVIHPIGLVNLATDTI